MGRLSPSHVLRLPPTLTTAAGLSVSQSQEVASESACVWECVIQGGEFLGSRYLINCSDTHTDDYAFSLIDGTTGIEPINTSDMTFNNFGMWFVCRRQSQISTRTMSNSS